MMDFEKGLIAAVKKNEILYDMKRPHPRDKHRKDKIWEAIACDLNVTVDQCKRRWKGLRDTYKRCKKAAEANSEHEQGWRYFESLSFLDGATIANEAGTTENVCDQEENLESDESGQFSTNFEQILLEIELPKQETNIEELGDDNNDTSKKFSEFLDMINTTGEKNSTTLIFQALDKKIKEANLPKEVVNAIESKIFKVVYDDIKNYQDYRKNSNQFQ